MREFAVSQVNAKRRAPALALAASTVGLVLALSGCGTIDNALFGAGEAGAPVTAAKLTQPQGLPGTLPERIAAPKTPAAPAATASATAAPAGAAAAAATPANGPLVTIRFDRADVDYKQTLYRALDQALKTRPNAAFNVVGVAPIGGPAPAMPVAQTAAARHAREVLRAMTDMGVPSARLSLSLQTDPTASGPEVRVYVR